MSAETDRAIAAITTNRQGRAALGIVATNLRAAYDVIATIGPEKLGPFLQAGGLFGDVGNDQVRDQATGLIDAVNAYATGLYATIADDDNGIDPTTRDRIGVALQQAESNLSLLSSVKSDLTRTFKSDLLELARNIETATLASAQWIADKAKQAVGLVVPTWVWWVLGGALVLGVVSYAASAGKGVR